MSTKTLNRVATLELGERKQSSDGLKRYPATLSTKTPIARRDAYGQRYSEVLSHAPGAVDRSRAPIPLLESHETRKVNVGIVTNLRLDGKRLRGDLVLGKSARAVELANDIDAGIVSGLSVGYSIDEIPDEGETRIATKWTLFETSLVSVPADANAGIGRSATNPNRSKDMFKKQKLQQQEEGTGAGGGVETA